MNIEVKLHQLRSYSNDLRSTYFFINKKRMQLMEVIEAIKYFEDDAMRVVYAKLKKQEIRLEEQVRKVHQFSSGLNKVIEAYEKAEDKIVDYGEGEKFRFEGWIPPNWNVVYKEEFEEFKPEPIDLGAYLVEDMDWDWEPAIAVPSPAPKPILNVENLQI